MPASRPFRYLGLALLLSIFILIVGQINVLAQTPDQDKLEQGARLYAENCVVCHGPNGEGRVGATLAKNWPSIRPDLTVETIIENGVQGSPMPAWSQENGGPLNQEQIDALVFYILSWQTGGFPTFAPTPTFRAVVPITPVPEVEGDPNNGAVLFAHNCAVCHGPQGEGRIGATLIKNWPSIRPDLTVKTTIRTGIPGSVMPAWSKENGGPLGESEINDLTAFILSRSETQVVQITPTAAPLSPVDVSWLSGWGGVLLFFVLFVVIIAGALIAQRRT